MKTNQQPWAAFKEFTRGVRHSDIQQEGDAVGVPYYWPARQTVADAEKIQVAGRPFWMTQASVHCGCGYGRCNHAAIWPADCIAVVAEEQPGRLDIDPDRPEGRVKIWVRSDVPGRPGAGKGTKAGIERV
jgi:hypothetical protein